MIADVTWTVFLSERLGELWLRTGEHLMLTGVSVGLAILVGIPLGILAAKVWWLRGPVTGGVGILQTVPSLAMLVLLLALLGKIGTLPAIIALTLYALLPIVRNTLTGLRAVPTAAVEAGRGIGMTPGQRLWLVELPLARPVILAGVRTAAVVCVGIATLSAFIGAGGLGQFINRGLSLSNNRLILLGAVSAAILALLVDGALSALQWGLKRQRSRGGQVQPALDRVLRPLAVAMPVLLVLLGGAAYVSTGLNDSADAWATGDSQGPTIRIGTKNFTEQLILGELMAQMIESHADCNVDRRFNLGGTMICHRALASGEIDLYAEYTGTALTAILKEKVIADPDSTYQAVANGYRRQFAAEWLGAFGFNNTYAITVRQKDAESRNLRSISDLAKHAKDIRAGFTAEFSERPDGYPGLRKAYGLRFGQVLDLDPALMYQAIEKGEVDVICAFATDGRIAAYKLKPLRDDRGFFPPYQAAPVVRQKTLQDHPEIREALHRLAGQLDDTTMQCLNYEVDEKKRAPADVAREFLTQRGLLNPSDETH